VCERPLDSLNPLQLRHKKCADRDNKRAQRKRERDRLAGVAPVLADLSERADAACDLVKKKDSEPWRALEVMSDWSARFALPALPADGVQALREGESPWVRA
jgi:hypothetical protein